MDLSVEEGRVSVICDFPDRKMIWEVSVGIPILGEKDAFVHLVYGLLYGRERSGTIRLRGIYVAGYANKQGSVKNNKCLHNPAMSRSKEAVSHIVQFATICRHFGSLSRSSCTANWVVKEGRLKVKGIMPA